MEPNAREIFSHVDKDGDEFRVLASRRDRLTVSVWGKDDGRSHLAYISRDGVAVLRDALAKWLDASEPEEAVEPILCVRCGHSPESHTGPSTCLGNRNLCGCELSRVECLDPGWAEAADPEPEAWTDAEAPFRPEALRLAVQLAKQNATESAVFSLADQMVHWLATGERVPVAAPTPQSMTFIDAAPKTDCLCGHPTSEHKRHGCMRWDESGREYCSCKRTPGSFDAAPPAPEEVAGVTTCGVCSHPYHGVVVCADGAPGTAHADRCQCRGRAEDYRR